MATEDRKRVGVPISGIDIAAPDHSVTDGKCETIHNLRYANGAWRNVHPFEGKRNLQQSRYKIIYHHPVTKDNEYIAEVKKKGGQDLFAFLNFEDNYYYLFPNVTIGVGDPVYNNNRELIGYVISERTQQYTEAIIGLIDGDEVEMLLNRDPSMDSLCSGIYMVRIEESGEVTALQKISDFGEDSEVSVSHFGKMLILSDHHTQDMKYFAFNGIDYSASLGTAKATLNITFGSSRLSPEVKFKVAKEYDELTNFGLKATITSAVVAYEKVCNPEKTEWYFQDFNEAEDDWRGEFAIFIALRMEDGSILYRTAPQIINSAQPSLSRNYTPDAEVLKQQPLLDNNYYASIAWDNSAWDNAIGGDYVIQEADYDRYSAEYHKFRTVECQINCDTDPLVHDVAIYATRLYSFLDRKKNGNFYNTVDLMTEPFYLMDVLDKTVSNTSLYKIRYSNLKNIEQKPLFEPTISHSAIYAEKMFDYNNSLHLLSPSTKRPLFFTDNIKTNDEEYGGAEFIVAEWLKDGIKYYSDYYPKGGPNVFSFIQDKLIVFSNNVANLYFAEKSNTNMYPLRGNVAMLYSPTLDMSYCIGLRSTYLGTPFLKYEAINSYNPDYDKNGNTITIDEFTTSVNEPNRIQVSEANNCFVYPYENSYRIGSNASTIVAANAAAIEMSDAKFGEFPLYVFTNEGVFAMQSGGGNSLYSAVVPISYDKAINPNTLAVNYNVLFVTERGIMSLNNQGVSLISEGLNKQDNTIPEWMRTTEMLHAPQHNEVFATDKEDNLLYVFSLDNKVWSTRDVEEGRILNNGEFVTEDKIINLLHETDVDELTEVAISTCPIKLGSMELKRLETFILRFESASDQTISIQISGSTDTVNWIPFRQVSVFTNRDIIIRRVPMSAKYIRVNITGSVTDDIKILAMEMEYYLRMLRRMR